MKSDYENEQEMQDSDGAAVQAEISNLEGEEMTDMELIREAFNKILIDYLGRYQKIDREWPESKPDFRWAKLEGSREQAFKELLSLSVKGSKTICIGAYEKDAELPEMPIYKDTEGNILPMRFTDRGILQVMKEAGFVKLIKGEKVEQVN